MPRDTPDASAEQSAFDFDAAPGGPRPEQREQRPGRETARETHETHHQEAVVIHLADRSRSKHFEVARRLLAETGVFRPR